MFSFQIITSSALRDNHITAYTVHRERDKQGQSGQRPASPSCWKKTSDEKRAISRSENFPCDQKIMRWRKGQMNTMFICNKGCVTLVHFILCTISTHIHPRNIPINFTAQMKCMGLLKGMQISRIMDINNYFKCAVCKAIWHTYVFRGV